MKPQAGFKSLPAAARWTIIMFALDGLGIATYMLTMQATFSATRVLFLIATAVLCARAKVNLFKGSTLSFLTSVVMFTVLTEGPGVAIVVAAVGVGAQTVLPSKKVVIHQLAFNLGMIILTVSATWWTHQASVTQAGMDVLSARLVATVLASFIYFMGNSVSVSLIIALTTKGMSMLDIWANHFLYSAPSFVIAGLVSHGFVAISNSVAMVIVIFVGTISLAYYCSIRLVAKPMAAKA